MLASAAKPVSMSGEPMIFTTETFEPARYRAACFPARNSEGQVENWTLKQLGDDGFHARLRDVLPEDECTYYAPTVNMMSGAVEAHDAFAITFFLDGHRRVRRPGYEGKERIPCDGTYIGFSDGGIMAAGGCPLIVLTGYGSEEEFCLFGHGGRDSLIDPSIHNGRPPRLHFSIVDAMVAYAVQHYGADPKRMLMRSFFSLPWQRFTHDPDDPRSRKILQALITRGQENAFLRDEKGALCLSLDKLILSQAERLGIGFVLDIGVFGLPEDGDFAYTRHPRPELRGSVRNLVVLQRY